jgi:hypothetical protein
MIRVTQGAVTVEIGGELESFVADLVRRTETAAVRSIRDAAEDVRAQAEGEWYDRVQKRTGRTGQIATAEVIDVARGEVRVSVGSTDTRKTAKGGKPIPLYVHEPGRTSTVEVEVDRAVWIKTTKSLRVPIQFRGGQPVYLVRRPNPKAGTGRYLVPTLIRKPMRDRVKAIAQDIAQGAARGK